MAPAGGDTQTGRSGVLRDFYEYSLIGWTTREIAPFGLG